MAAAELQANGWYLSGEGIAICSNENGRGLSALVKNAQDSDLREIGEKWLPDDINKGKVDYVEGPGVLQLMKIRNVSAPRENEESQTAPRMLKLTLTDGHNNCIALETEPMRDIGLYTPPGTKVKLVGTVDVQHGFLLLNNKNVKVLGGRVDKLAENWELRKKLSKQSRTNIASEGGPPPFVPFGQKISSQRPQNIKIDNFKSFTQSKENRNEDAEFEKQRQETIAQALQTKDDGKVKKFGGQKQLTQDRDVAKIVEMGFTAEDASNALRITNGDVHQAISYLLSGGKGPPREDFRDRNRQGPPRDNYQSQGPPRDSYQSQGPPRDSYQSQGPPRDSYRDRDRQGPPRDNYRDKDRDRQGPPRDNYRDRDGQGLPSNNYIAQDRDRQGPAQGGQNVDRREPSKGRGWKGRNQDEDEEGHMTSKPSGPATLFDFLGTKFKDEKENKNSSSNPKQAVDRNNSSSNSQTSYKQRDIHQSSNYNTARERKQNNSDQSVSNSECSQSNQGHNQIDQGNRQQKLPPRLANKYSNNSNTPEFNQNKQDSRPNTAPTSQGANRNKSYNNYDNERQHLKGNFNRKQDSQTETSSQRNFDSLKKTPKQYERTSNSKVEQCSAQPNSFHSSHVTPQPSMQLTNVQQQNSDRGRPVYQENVYNGRKNRGEYNNNSDPNWQAVNDNNDKQPPPQKIEWKRGDRCLAKYWEDKKYYNAVIEAVGSGLPTCIVSFTEYNNSEEVYLADIKPLIQPDLVDSVRQRIDQGRHPVPSHSPLNSVYQHPPPPMHFTVPPPNYPVQNNFNRDHFASVEFRRGGKGNYKQNQDRKQKPTQQYYEPPRQRDTSEIDQ